MVTNRLEGFFEEPTARRPPLTPLEQAGVPCHYRACSFATLDPSSDPEAFEICRLYGQTGHYQGKHGLLLMGPPGNGKTSVARIATELLVAQGLSTGTYTSPHLERVNERITWNAREVERSRSLTVAEIRTRLEAGRGRLRGLADRLAEPDFRSPEGWGWTYENLTGHVRSHAAMVAPWCVRAGWPPPLDAPVPSDAVADLR